MTSDPENPPQGMAEEATAFEGWEDAFIARNRVAINHLLEEAYEDVREGREVKWDVEDAIRRNRLRYEEYLANRRS
ncbi:hypothetical protein GVN21_18115 [Caulobacter sp. SLTY]|uniref:hypothetical protein n=1 Tax=Caulobacter sp. SLTY TaxID=2683262 RepID=UPI0014132987|nr:hypothetical protein [Caulobacter sp. SLTY]NBB17282.1 hypothetical protein [Caulobacter sp. SLTY]